MLDSLFRRGDFVFGDHPVLIEHARVLLQVFEHREFARAFTFRGDIDRVRGRRLQAR